MSVTVIHDRHSNAVFYSRGWRLLNVSKKNGLVLAQWKPPEVDALQERIAELLREKAHMAYSEQWRIPELAYEIALMKGAK